MRILALTRYGRLGASSRLRSLQFESVLEAMGVAIRVQPLIGDEMLREKYESRNYRSGRMLKAYAARIWQMLSRRQFDLVWIEKEALPWMPAALESVLLRGVPYALDYDDAIFHNYDLHASKWVRRALGRRIDRLMAGARLVVGGNDYLAQRARDAGAPRVEVVPTVVDLDRYGFQAQHEQTGVPHLVWIGSPSTVKYLGALEMPLAVLAGRFEFKLRVIGATLDMAGVDVECVPWTEETEAQAIALCDVGIMPLADSPWERGKCGYKLIQYMACGLPVVASPVGVNKQIVRDGIDGFLAEAPDVWVARLEQLLGNPVLRKTMGKAGRHRVEAEYSVQQVGPWLASMLLSAGGETVCSD